MDDVVVSVVSSYKQRTGIQHLQLVTYIQRACINYVGSQERHNCVKDTECTTEHATTFENVLPPAVISRGLRHAAIVQSGQDTDRACTHSVDAAIHWHVILAGKTRFNISKLNLIQFYTAFGVATGYHMCIYRPRAAAVTKLKRW